jgi:predicted RNA methylase
MTQIQTKGLRRNTIDKFYTKPKIADYCINVIQQTLNISKTHDLIIEPSAGNGVFISAITQICNHYKFYDIQPEHDDIIKQDFLELNNIPQTFSKIHIIGNPPFGRQSSIAIKFIKKSCQFCDSLSFILPKSFRKESLQRHFPLQFHLVHEEDLPKNSFLVDGNEYNVETILQIWIKQDIDRQGIVKIRPNSFQFVKKTENHDISFRRVGVYAGKIDTETKDKSIQSHYFIKFLDNTDLDTIIKKLQTITYPTNHTVGPKSISKRELILEFNKVL